MWERSNLNSDWIWWALNFFQYQKQYFSLIDNHSFSFIVAKLTLKEMAKERKKKKNEEG